MFKALAQVHRGSFLRRSYSSSENSLNSREYRNFTLKAKRRVNHNSFIFTFDYPHEFDIPLGQHLSLRANINSQVESRPYTPITPRATKGQIDFLAKVYPHGAMSRHLDSLSIGDQIEILGPIGHYSYDKSSFKSIGMVGAGTGITPLYQIIQEVLPTTDTKITLIYANNREEDILLKEELENWKHRYPGRLEIHYVLAEVNNIAGHQQYIPGFVDKNVITKYLSQQLVLICGPVPMEESVTKIMHDIGFDKSRYVCFTKTDFSDIEKVEIPKSGPREYTLDDIKSHKEEDDCWMAISGKVYDVTKFVPEHPGGYIILDGGGTDATALFHDSFPHSDDAIDLLKNFYLGELKQ